MNKIFLRSYIFIDQIDKLNKLKLLKLNNVVIIIDINEKIEKNDEKELFIIKFARRNKIPFIIKNNYRKCSKYNSDGIFIDSTNKNQLRPIISKKKFDRIGLAHDQKEYFLKLRQGCKIVMLSPVFFNKKYSKFKLLGTLKFNLITLNWKVDVCLLGGINKKNLNKINITKSQIYASKSSIFNF
jgi:thiamine monophosphate synthase